MQLRRPVPGGQAVVEMALVLPILLMTVFGTLDFGRAIYAHSTLASAVREGARRAVIPTVPGTVIVNTVVNRAAAIHVAPGDVIVTGSRAPGSTVVVAASCIFEPATPLIAELILGALGEPLRLHAQTSMTVE